MIMVNQVLIPLWTNIHQLIDDEKYDCNSLAEQLLATFNYVKTFPTILSHLEDYERIIEAEKHEYMKQEWTLFKPLSNNKLIIGIQNLISEQIDLKYLKKIYSTFTIENITLLRSINSQKNHCQIMQKYPP